MGSLRLLEEAVSSTKTQETEFRSCVKDDVERKVLLQASCSHVALTDEALMEEANRHPNSPSLGLLDSRSRSLQMLLRDGKVLEMFGSDSKDPSGKELAIRAEELRPSKALEHACILEEEDPISLPSKFVHFNNFVGMPIARFKKEISSLLKNLEARQGHGVKISDRKKNHLLASYLERELRKLEYATNYNSSQCGI